MSFFSCVIVHDKMSDSFPLKEAIISNNLDQVTKLVDQKCDQPLTGYCDLVVKHGDLEMLKLLHKHGFPWGVGTTGLAAELNRLGMLRYLRENGCPWDIRVCYQASYHGYLDMLKYLHDNDSWTLSTVTIRLCVIQGHLPVLQFLHEKGYPLKEDLMRIAAKRGHLECLNTWLFMGMERFRIMPTLLPNVENSRCSSSFVTRVCHGWIITR